MGDKGNEPDSSRMAEKMAGKYWDEARPMLKKYGKRGNQFMRGDFDPTASPMYESGRLGIENQYDVAREGLISNMPAGGQLFSEMGDLGVDRASALTGLEGGIAQDEYNKAYGFLTGAPQASMGTLASLAGSQAAAQSQETGAKYGGLGEIGGGLGMMYGMKES